MQVGTPGTTSPALKHENISLALGIRIQGLESVVFGCGVSGLGFGGWSLGFWVEGLAGTRTSAPPAGCEPRSI